jgi:WD40 repeat protein/serine/threonine protein kinase
MIKCPSCGVKVQGNDLLTGVCSNCHHRISVGDSATGSEDLGATLAREVRRPGSGSPIVDSVSGGISGYQLNSAGSKDSSGAQSGLDSGTDQTIQSDEFLGSSSDSGSAGSRPVQAPTGTLSHEAQRPDTGYDSGHVAEDQNESQATFVSDEFGDGAGGATCDVAGTASGVSAAADGLGSATLDSATLSGENNSDKTFVSDVEDESADAEASLRTIIENPSAEFAAGDSDRTYVHDAESDFGGDEAGMRTRIEDPAANAPNADSDKTFVADEFVSGNDPEAGAKTLNSEMFEAEAASGGTDKTFVADEMPEALLKTVESVWGQPSAGDNTAPSTTLKAKEPRTSKLPRQTLVIKTKSFAEVKAGRQISRDGDAPEYELLKVLGEGGMGIVYDARQTSIDRNVAVKMLKPATAGNEKQRAKFLAEAVVTGDLDHPNIVPIYDVGSNGEGALFYSMKKVQGTPWMKVIQKKSVSENLDILMRIADAIGFAHARGIVHRDLKPENVMLGEFGEVLVMDWGLAQASSLFRKSRSITETNTIGGTPAYMAPEMATGPIEKISPASDVYLLGAMLYEIVTGGPPHVAKTAMKCLMAAARNEIAPTDKTGELIDIALKAMKTDPKDRYQDVKSFQAAIRDYQSHSESIVLSTRAEEDLKEARLDDDYQHFSRALFGFQEAHELWPGNKLALAGISEAQLAYADSARRKGDFDLGLSLLDAANPDHGELRRLLIEAQQDVVARHKRLVFLKRMAGGLAAAVFLIVCTASALIYRAQQDAITQRDIAESKQKEAVEAKNKEEIARTQAVRERDNAVKATELARAAQKQEALARKEADKERDNALQAQELERVAKANAEYEAYISQIGLAASQIDKNAFDAARDVLNRCKPELRNWEWGRLKYLCYQSEQDFPGPSPLDALAIRRDGERFAVSGRDATARIVDRKTGNVIHTLPHGGEYVHAIAFSPDGKFVATGSNDPAGFVQLWDAETGKRIRIFSGHEDAVLSVAFSNNGESLVSGSYDKTARLWDVATGTERRVFKGHTWWVWSAAFSSDDRKLVTASQDGTARVWEVATGKPLQTEFTEAGGEKTQKEVPPFRGHHGPVYSAAFSPNDSDEVVTGGYDHRILVWKPSDIEPENFKNLAREEGSIVPPAKFVAMEGHTDAVRSLAFSSGSGGVLLVSAGQDHTVRVWDYASRQPIKAFRGHGGSVQAAAFVSDGRSILSASHDKSVRQWSIDNYEEIRTLRGRVLSGHQDAVLSAAYSNDQTQVVTASRDRTARTWEARTGKQELMFEEGHAYLASSALFYPGGRRLLTAAVDNTARVWDVSTGGQLFLLDHSGRSAAVALSHDGRWIATGGDDKSAQLWDAQSGQRLQKLEGHIAEVTAVSFSPDHQLLATGDAKGHAKLWNIAEGRVVHELKGHTRKISAIVFLPDGSRVLTASLDKTVSQWDVASGRELPQLSLRHPDGVQTMKLVPGREPRVVTSCSILKRADKVSGTADKAPDQHNDRDHKQIQSECQLRVWSLTEPKVERTLGPLDGDVYSLDVSADGNRLIAANSRERTVRQWELSSGLEVQLPRRNGELGPIIDLKSQGLLWSTAFLPDSDDILTVGGRDARLWNIRTNPVSERMSFSPHRAVASARFSPDGNLIVTGSWDNSAKIWDARTGKDIRKLEGVHAPIGQDDAQIIARDPSGGHTSLVNSAEFSHDGRLVLTASDDGTAKIWDVATGRVVQTLAGHSDRVRSATFSPDGKLIVTTSSDKTARLWNGETGVLVRAFKGHKWDVLCAGFSNDGLRLVTGSEDNEAWIWDVATARVLHKLTGHTASVTSVAFSPDGSRVITGSQDQSAKLWDAKGREILAKEILTLSRHTADVTSVAFSPFDGKQILTASRDGTAVIWLALDWTAKEELSAIPIRRVDKPAP